ncbi:MAG: hypothetical protein AB7W16_24200 [Candidatus Obscuribacterales bacterium]
MDIRDLDYFLSRFANRTDGYYVQVPNERRYQARWQDLTREQLVDHINGVETLSLPAVSKDGTCKWLAWDSDHDLGHLEKVDQFLKSEGLHTLRAARREGREGHLFLMLDEPVSAVHAVRFGQEVLSYLNIPSGNGGLEFLPKQAAVRRLSNGLRIPLGINMKPGIWTWSFFEGVENEVSKQLQWFREQPLNSSELIAREAQKLNKRDMVRESRAFRCTGLLERSRREKLNLLGIIPAYNRRRLGSGWIAQCPVCEAEGHDKSRDNLHISGSDGTLFCCWYGGQPGRLHTAKMIADSFRS